MAAHCWRLMLLCEMGLAITIAALAGVAFEIPLLPAALTGLAVLLLPPFSLIGVREWVALQRAALAMSVEPWRHFQYDGWRGSASRPANPVLLIHGVVCNRGIWRPMAAALQAHGFGPIRAVNLEPLLGNIDSHAAYVANEIRQLRRDCGGARVAIIAHSMGGLVARNVLRLLGPDDISRIVTLGSPHHGTSLARALPGLPYRQMEPGSAWLAELNAAQEGHFRVPVTCIYSANDILVRPPWSAALEGTTRIELERLGHLGLLSARQAIDCTLAALTGSRPRRELLDRSEDPLT